MGKGNVLRPRRNVTCFCLSSLTIWIRQAQSLLSDCCQVLHRRKTSGKGGETEDSSSLRLGKGMWQGVSIHSVGMCTSGVFTECLKDHCFSSNANRCYAAFNGSNGYDDVAMHVHCQLNSDNLILPNQSALGPNRLTFMLFVHRVLGYMRLAKPARKKSPETVQFSLRLDHHFDPSRLPFRPLHPGHSSRFQGPVITCIPCLSPPE